MNWPRTILDGLMMTGWFCFAVGAGILFRPMMACSMYPKRFFTSAPKAAQEVIQPKEARFKGQHAVGWLMMILALVLLAGAVIFGAYDGIQKDFGWDT